MLGKFTLISLIFTGYILLMLYLPSTILFDLNFVAISIPLPETLQDYRSTLRLKSSEIITDQIAGPESLAYSEKHAKFITGSLDGYLYEFNDDGQQSKLFKLINSSIDQRIARPLGLKFDPYNNYLWVTESYAGIYRVKNVFTAKPIIELVLDIDETSKQLSAGNQSVFFDDLAIYKRSNDPGKDDYVLYITSVSRKFQLHEFFKAMAEPDRTGQVLRYDMESKRLDIILDGLLFTNGIESLADNKGGFLFSESMKRTIWKCVPVNSGNNDLKCQELIPNMASATDNIRQSPNGQTYWLSMFHPRSEMNPELLDRMLKYPQIRRILARTLYLLGSILEFIHKQLISMDIFDYYSKSLKTFDILLEFGVPGCLFLEIDSNGNFVNSFNYENCSHVSEVREISRATTNDNHERHLYLGSYRNKFVEKLILIPNN